MGEGMKGTGLASILLLGIVLMSGVACGKDGGVSPTPTPTPTASATLLPTSTATPQPTATEPPAESATPEEPEKLGGGCFGGGSYISFPDYGSNLTIKCGECWIGDTFYYYGDFIYEDEPDRGYHNLRNPSYDELMAFLESDKTDEIPHTPDFKCQQFSLTLRERANEQGLRCACVLVYWVPVEGGAGLNYTHALSAFNTTDRGLIHIEPQQDTEFLIEEQWQPWPCGVMKSNMSVDDCWPTSNMLYCVIYIW